VVWEERAASCFGFRLEVDENHEETRVGYTPRFERITSHLQVRMLPFSWPARSRRLVIPLYN